MGLGMRSEDVDRAEEERVRLQAKTGGVVVDEGLDEKNFGWGERFSVRAGSEAAGHAGWIFIEVSSSYLTKVYSFSIVFLLYIKYFKIVLHMLIYCKLLPSVANIIK